MSGIDLSDPIFHDEEKARLHLEQVRWPDGVTCPLCGGTEKVKTLGGKTQGPGWYHCGDCRRKFTVRSGSVYERSHIPLHKWVMATHLLCASKKGISAHQLHRMLGVTYKSAWFMAHRIREAMIDTGSGPLGGEGEIIEADETFTGPSEIVEEGNGLKRRRGTHSKRVVVSLVERKPGGRARSIHAEKLTRENVQKVLDKHADKTSHLMTDDAPMYRTIGKKFWRHDSVKHTAGIYSRPIGIHTNTIEGYFSIFKRGMKGVYQHCGEQHLQRYLTEFDFRYSNRTINDAERAVAATKGAAGKRLTYRQANGRA